MSGFHHIDMFHIHLTHPRHEGCCIKESMSYVLWIVYVVSLSVRVQSQSSPINVFICSTDLTLSHFPKKPSLIQLPETMCFVYATIKLPPLPVQSSQCVETPTSLACSNPASFRGPNHHYSLEMCKTFQLHQTQKFHRGVLSGPLCCNIAFNLETVQSFPSCLVGLACINCAEGPPKNSLHQQSMFTEIVQIYFLMTIGKCDMLKLLSRS